MSVARRIEALSIPEPNTGCWLWTGTTSHAGYGIIRIGGRSGRLMRAHRVSYEVHRGPIPPGVCVCHRCDTPPCVNPDHLWLGTNAENTADKTRKGRAKGSYLPGELCGKAKLTNADVLAMRASGATNEALAREHGVSAAHVSKVRSGKQWVHILPAMHASEVGKVLPKRTRLVTAKRGATTIAIGSNPRGDVIHIGAEIFPRKRKGTR